MRIGACNPMLCPSHSLGNFDIICPSLPLNGHTTVVPESVVYSTLLCISC